MEDLGQDWRTSSFSGNGGECVEVGQVRDAVVVRDSKDRAGAVLRFTADAWRTFADQQKRS